MRPFGKSNTSTRSVRTTSPAAAMWCTSKRTLSTPVVNPAMVCRMATVPSTGATGMLWYTASSAKNAMIASRSPAAHESQNARTTAIGSSAITVLEVVDAGHVRRGVVRGVAERLHRVPEHRLARAPDLLQLPRLSLERPRLRLELLRLREVLLRLFVPSFARQPRAEPEVGE